MISLEGWERFLSGGSIYMGLFWKSIRMSLTVSVVVVLLAYPIGYFLALCAPKRKYVLLLLIIAPFLTSFLLRVLAWKVILGEAGVLNSFLSWAHLRASDDPITWLLYSQFTVMLVLAYVWVPFVALPIFVSLDNLDRSLLEAAATWGEPVAHVRARHAPAQPPGGPRGVPVRVHPHDREFVTPLLVGGTSGYMYGNAIQDLFTRGSTGRRGRCSRSSCSLVVAGLMAVFGRFVQVRSGGRLMRDRDLAEQGALLSLRVFFGLLVVFLYVPIALLAVFSFNDGRRDVPARGVHARLVRAGSSRTPRSGGAGAQRDRRGDLEHRGGGARGTRRRSRCSAGGSFGKSGRLRPGLLAARRALRRVRDLAARALRVRRQGPDRGDGLYIGLGLHSVVIGHVVVSLPYTVLTIMPLLERLSVSLEEAAKDLGAAPWQSFRRVTLPLLMPALVSAFMIAFTLSFDEYAIASFLGGYRPTWPVYLFAQLRVPSQLPQLLAVSSVVLVFSLLLVVGAEIIRRLTARRYGREFALAASLGGRARRIRPPCPNSTSSSAT